MQNTEKIAVLCGDTRQITVANTLLEKGCDISVYGMEPDALAPKIRRADTLADCLKDCSAVVLPVPCSKDDRTVYTSAQTAPVFLRDVFSCLPDGAVLYGGSITEAVRRQAAPNQVKMIDYLACEELAIQNAVPTAEGALAIAMAELPITIHGANAMVIGYGRIGKVLSDMLRALGASVTVLARKGSDLAWIEMRGMHAVHSAELLTHIGGQDVIFNTVPAQIIKEQALRQMQKQAVLIDLASNPGGVDPQAADTTGRRVVKALSLPGKVAPVTAGRIITDTVLHLLWQKGGV